MTGNYQQREVATESVREIGMVVQSSDMDRLYSLNLKTIVQTIYTEGWAFICVCLYLFFEYVRPQSIYTQIDILPWVPIVLIFGSVLAVVNGEFGQSSPCIISKFMLCYAIIVVISMFNSQYSEISLKNWRVFFDWLFIYFFLTILINNEKRFFIFVCLFLLFSFKMSQHGFLSWASRGFAFAGWGVTGAPGWFHNSGEVGIQMCIFVPLSIFFIIAIRKYISKIWLSVCLLLPFTGVSTIIASSSRGALVGLAGAGCWSILKRPKVLFWGGIALCVIAIVVFRSIPEQSMQRFRTTGDDNDNTSLIRLERWKHGIEGMNDNPIFGIGFNVWPEYYVDYYVPEYQGTALVHNIFIQCGSELGYSGLLVFILLIFSNFFVTRKVRRLTYDNPDQVPTIISYGLDAGLIGFLVSGCFITVLYYPYFWIHCAMVTSLHSMAVKKYQN